MTNEIHGIAAQVSSGLFDLAWPIALKYGSGIGGVFFVVAWIKEWIPAEPNTKKVIIPILALFLGVIARFVTIAGEVALGSHAPSLVWWYILLEVCRGAGVGITASLFQKWIGWRIEKWMKSLFKNKG